MQKNAVLCAVLLGGAFLSGCASYSSTVAASHVPSSAYEDSDCAELTRDYRRVSTMAVEVAEVQDQIARDDA